MPETRLIFDDKERVGAWVAEQVGQRAPWSGHYAMGVETNGELTAGFVFESFNGVNAMVHIAVTKPNKAFVKLLDHGYRYAFEYCGLRRLTGLVEATNEKACRLNKHLGYIEEARLAGAGPEEQDIIVFALWPENYRKGRRDGR